jgi:hypothetical protein
MPFKRDQAKVERLIDRIGANVDRVLQQTGLSENEFADLLDPKKPFPNDDELARIFDSKTPARE